MEENLELLFSKKLKKEEEKKNEEIDKIWLRKELEEFEEKIEKKKRKEEEREEDEMNIINWVRKEEIDLKELENWEKNLILLEMYKKFPKLSPLEKMKINLGEKILEKIEKKKQILFFKRNEQINQKLFLFNGDITRLKIECIVNAANIFLKMGSGLDGVNKIKKILLKIQKYFFFFKFHKKTIHLAAGKNLQKECDKIFQNTKFEKGSAVITSGYDLPAKLKSIFSISHFSFKIISCLKVHTSGPFQEDSKTLRKCYENTLNLMLEKKIKRFYFFGNVLRFFKSKNKIK